jgi:serine/threonine-protein kinase
VIDFGIAKASTNSEATQAGTIKGKLSYLAPEYLDGLDLDARYDEFAVGITLWEMLCSRKLFQANNDLAVLKQIQACKIIPPSEINPSVPKELDAIVMKALSKDRSHRYENLDQLNRALVRFLYSTYPDFNASDLNTFAEDLFKAEITKDQDKFVEYGKIDIQPYIEDMKQEESRTGKVNKKDIGMSARPTASKDKEPEREKIREIELDIAPAQVEITIDHNKDKTATRKLAKASLQQAKATSRNTKMNSSSSSVRSPSKDKTSSRVMSKKELAAAKEAEENSSQSSIIILIIAASFAGLAYFQGDMIEGMTGFNLYKMIHGEPSRTISSEPVTRRRGNKPIVNTAQEVAVSGKIILSGVDISMEVYLNGNKVESIGRPLSVDLNQDVTVSVKKPGYVPFVKKVMLTKEMNSQVVAVPELEKARMGLLTTSQNYTAGSKLVYEEAGEVIERQLPFKDVEIPEGTYQARVVNPILGTEKKVEFSIEENRKHFLE